MIKFNTDTKKELTYSEIFEPTLRIKTKAEAGQYLSDYINWMIARDSKLSLEEATKIAKDNLGYYAGYYSNKVRTKTEKLFDCEHPVFGSIKKNGIPTAEEAFRLGMEMAKKNRNEL